MRYGACSWIFGDAKLAEVAGKLSELGYEGIELLGDWERYFPKETKTILEDHNLSVFSLTPKNVDLAHPKSEVREEAIDYYLRLLEFAASLKAPIVSCHGAVGRVRALTSQLEEEKLFRDGVSLLAERAERMGIQIAIEGLNRYESHLLNTADELRSFVEEIDSPAVGILLDTYHMNIEEADLSEAVRTAGKKLFLFHVADSNRCGIGKGHIRFSPIFQSLNALGYPGPIIVECTAPGPDPFTPIKGKGWYEKVWDEVRGSIHTLKALEAASD